MTNLKTVKKVYTASAKLDKKYVEQLFQNLATVSGVVNLEIVNDGISIEFDENLVNETYLKDALINFEFPFDSQKDKKGIVKRFIEKIAHDNRKEFGHGGPHCCG